MKSDMFRLFLLILILLQPMNAQTLSNRHYTYYHRGSQKDLKAPVQGGLALVGGSTDREEVFQWMAERAGHGDFLVLRGSGSDGYQDFIADNCEVNSVSTIVLKDREAAEDPFVLEKVKNAEAIFFAGGDQWNYVGKWKGTALQEALNQALLQGVPMGGTSAGLAILGRHVYSAQSGSVTPEEALADPYHPSITLESDFLHAQALRGTITDTHFSQRRRMGRLLTFMSRLQQDQNLREIHGIGVDEKTAVLVDAQGKGRVVGEHQAYFVSTEKAPTVCKPGSPLSHPDFEVHRLSAGESFDLTHWSTSDGQASVLEVKSGRLQAR